MIFHNHLEKPFSDIAAKTIFFLIFLNHSSLLILSSEWTNLKMPNTFLQKGLKSKCLIRNFQQNILI